MTNPIERAREKVRTPFRFFHDADACIDEFLAALAEEGPTDEMVDVFTNELARLEHGKRDWGFGWGNCKKALHVMLAALNSKEKEYADNDKNSR